MMKALYPPSPIMFKGFPNACPTTEWVEPEYTRETNGGDCYDIIWQMILTRPKDTPDAPWQTVTFNQCTWVLPARLRAHAPRRSLPSRYMTLSRHTRIADARTSPHLYTAVRTQSTSALWCVASASRALPLPPLCKRKTVMERLVSKKYIVLPLPQTLAVSRFFPRTHLTAIKPHHHGCT